MTAELLLAFVAFALVTSITPGPNNMMLLASGVNFGIRRSLPHMLGISLGFMVLVIAVGMGLGQLEHAIQSPSQEKNGKTIQEQRCVFHGFTFPDAVAAATSS